MGDISQVFNSLKLALRPQVVSPSHGTGFWTGLDWILDWTAFWTGLHSGLDWILDWTGMEN